MSVTETIINAEQRRRILEMQETHFTDLKAIEIGPAKLSRTVAAFANADGGELYIGVNEDKKTGSRTWRGFTNQEEANGHIQCFEPLFPLGQDFYYTFLACPGSCGLVLQLGVNKTREIKRASDGKVYLRRGPQNLPQLTEDELRRLSFNKGLTSFETELLNVDPVIITNSEPIIGFMLEVIPTAEPEAWLKKQQLVQNNKPTVAGVLLFAEEPQAVLPKRSSIKIYRYKTQDAVGTRETLAADPITVEGCMYEQIRSAVKKTVDLVESIQRLGPTGLERISYPVETLHEIITNAVLHRDYSIADDVHVRVFDNRIEVESPGRLPAHITVQNILEERFARNGTIVRLINKFPDPPNKDVGEGLNTAFEAMRKLRLKDPIIEQRDNSVLIVIRHEPLASPEEIIMDYLAANDSINNATGRRICHIGSENEMKRIFLRLVKRRLIEQIPGRRGSARGYQKPAAEEEEE